MFSPCNHPFRVSVLTHSLLGQSWTSGRQEVYMRTRSGYTHLQVYVWLSQRPKVSKELLNVTGSDWNLTSNKTYSIRPCCSRSRRTVKSVSAALKISTMAGKKSNKAQCLGFSNTAQTQELQWILLAIISASVLPSLHSSSCRLMTLTLSHLRSCEPCSLPQDLPPYAALSPSSSLLLRDWINISQAAPQLFFLLTNWLQRESFRPSTEQ